MNSGQAGSKQSKQSKQNKGASWHRWEDIVVVLAGQKSASVLAQYRNCHYHRSAGLHYSHTYAND